MSRYPFVERPLTINGCNIRNRVFRSAHGTMLTNASAGIINDALIAYHVARARGGVGLAILDVASVHPGTLGGIMGWKTENDDRWPVLVEACHAEGMKVFQQIFHGGSTQGRNAVDGAPSWSPSGGPSPGSPHPSVAMTKAMIDEIIERHVNIAVRCKKAGLDGVELHSAHGYMLHEFLSPLTNHRTDDYGGSLENRMRFTLETLRAMRAALGQDYPLGMRLSGSEWMEGGLSSADLITLVQRAEQEKLVDFIDLSAGSYFKPHKIMAGMHEQAGYEMPASSLISKATKLPCLVNGRFTTLQQVEDVLKSGAAEMVSMVRAMVADPELVKKSLEGREAEVRPCIGCSQECIGGVLGPRGSLACVVNVDAGYESQATPITKAARQQKVMVVGAGPSGMEAARTAALRGHKVVVHDAAPETGGNIRLARRAPYRGDIGRIIDFQTSELRRLGVEVHLNSRVELETVRQAKPDHVIVAAGAEAARSGIQRMHQAAVPGADLPHVRTMQEVLASTPVAGTHAVVLDDLGTYQAIGVTEHLLAGGVHVTFASSLPSVGAELAASLVQRPSAERLGGYDTFAFLPLQTVVQVATDHVVLREVGNARERKVKADLVVFCTAGVPRQDLYHALLQLGFRTQVVGDAVASTHLGRAIATGHNAAMAI